MSSTVDKNIKKQILWYGLLEKGLKINMQNFVMITSKQNKIQPYNFKNIFRIGKRAD